MVDNQYCPGSPNLYAVFWSTRTKSVFCHSTLAHSLVDGSFLHKNESTVDFLGTRRIRTFPFLHGRTKRAAWRLYVRMTATSSSQSLPRSQILSFVTGRITDISYSFPSSSFTNERLVYSEGPRDMCHAEDSQIQTIQRLAEERGSVLECGSTALRSGSASRLLSIYPSAYHSSMNIRTGTMTLVSHQLSAGELRPKSQSYISLSSRSLA